MNERRDELAGAPAANAPVAIVVPAYNAGRYLPELLTSIAGQSILPREVIIVDDGSTDGTADVVARELARHRAIVQVAC